MRVIPISYAVSYGEVVSDEAKKISVVQAAESMPNRFEPTDPQSKILAQTKLFRYEETLDSKPQLSFGYTTISEENGNTKQAKIQVSGSRSYLYRVDLSRPLGGDGQSGFRGYYENTESFAPLIINYSDSDNKVDVGLLKYTIEDPVMDEDGSVVFYLAPPASVLAATASEEDSTSNCQTVCNCCCNPNTVSVGTISASDLSFEDLSDAAEIVTTLGGDGAIYSAWMTDLTDLRKRLGEVRYGAQDGIWAKVIAQKDKVTGLTGADFKQKLYGLQIGMDHIITQNEARMWLAGANFKFNTVDQKVEAMRYGHGDLRTYGAFLYATYADYKGYYADLVLSIDHYKQKMTAEQTDDTYVHGKFNTWGWGASVEVGKMFSSTQDDEDWGPWYNHWWIEPQAQLAYYWVKGKRFLMDNAMDVKQKNGNSLIGRLGVVIGKKFNYGSNRKEVDKRYSQFYLKGGIKHEFMGKQTLHVDGMKFSDKLRGTRVYYGAGFDWNLTDQLRLYAQVEREHGTKYKKDYEVSAGLKWQF